MIIDEDTIDEMVLALLYLTTHESHGQPRAWKGHDWDALNRLHAAGMIGNPKSKAKSVPLTDQGAQRSRQLFERHFQRPTPHSDAPD